MNEVDPKIYRFGPFHIDLEQRVLFRGGVAVSLTQKAFDTLAILVERQGKVVDKAELMRLVWPETFVEENNLTQNISTLRKALGEGEYIETIPRRGYRFISPVGLLIPLLPTELAANGVHPAAGSIPRKSRWRLAPPAGMLT